MHPTKDEIKDWLKNTPDRSRKWLAEKTGASPKTVNNWLSGGAEIPNATLTLIGRLREDDLRAEQQRKLVISEPSPLQNLVLEVDTDTFERWSRAALSHNEIITEYAIRAIEEAAKRDASVVPGASPIYVLPRERNKSWRADNGNNGEVRFAWPFLGGVAAGAPTRAEVRGQTYMLKQPLEEGHYLLQVDGTSMEPNIPDGSLIKVRRLKDGEYAKQKDIVIYNDGLGATLKRLGYRKPKEGEDEKVNNFGKVAILTSDNPAFTEVQTLEDGRITAVFVAIVEESH